MFADSTVLVVADGSEIEQTIRRAIGPCSVHLSTVHEAGQAVPGVRSLRRCVVIVECPLREEHGALSLLVELKRLDPMLPVILIAARADVAIAVEAMRAGACDFLVRPFPDNRLAQVLFEALLVRCAHLDAISLDHEPRSIEAQIVGRSRAADTLRGKVLALAAVDSNVLILGETGTGKELAARSLHAFGGRCGHPFVALNCAGLPDTLFESEVFGHEHGAFTGTAGRRIGRLEFAGQGTLFLDEIETMPRHLQCKLLRVLQERSFERLGSNELRPLRCRIVAGTKVDLCALSAQGAFREDLYYRLAVVELPLPPLRERQEDIPLLFQKFVFDAAKAADVALRPVPGAYLLDLMSRHWPGNVRELRNAAERFVLGMLSGDELGGASHLAPASFEQRLHAFERHLIVQALHGASGCVSRAARELEMSRRSLYDKMRKLDIRRSDFPGVKHEE